jgi:hypothetical protein
MKKIVELYHKETIFRKIIVSCSALLFNDYVDYEVYKNMYVED